MMPGSKNVHLTHLTLTCQLLTSLSRLEIEVVRSQRAQSRDECIKYAEEMHALLESNASLLRDRLELGEQIASAEEAMKAMRAETASLRLQIVEARTEAAWPSTNRVSHFLDYKSVCSRTPKPYCLLDFGC